MDHCGLAREGGVGDYVHELVEKTKPHHPFGRFQNKLGMTGVWVALSRNGRGWLVVVVIRCGWQKSGGQELLYTMLMLAKGRRAQQVVE